MTSIAHATAPKTISVLINLTSGPFASYSNANKITALKAILIVAELSPTINASSIRAIRVLLTNLNAKALN